MSVDELLLTIKAIREREKNERNFIAAVNGIDMSAEESKGDITDLKGFAANQEGFGVGAGIEVLNLE